MSEKFKTDHASAFSEGKGVYTEKDFEEKINNHRGEDLFKVITSDTSDAVDDVISVVEENLDKFKTPKEVLMKGLQEVKEVTSHPRENAYYSAYYHLPQVIPTENGLLKKLFRIMKNSYQTHGGKVRD